LRALCPTTRSCIRMHARRNIWMRESSPNLGSLRLLYPWYAKHVRSPNARIKKYWRYSTEAYSTSVHSVWSSHSTTITASFNFPWEKKLDPSVHCVRRWSEEAQQDMPKRVVNAVMPVHDAAQAAGAGLSYPRGRRTSRK